MIMLTCFMIMFVGEAGSNKEGTPPSPLRKTEGLAEGMAGRFSMRRFSLSAAS